MKKDANFGMLSTFTGGNLWGINGVMGSFIPHKKYHYYLAYTI